MQEIYARCQECLVWLGDRTTDVDTAIDAIPRISKHLKLYDDARKTWEREGIAVSSLEVLNSSLWKGLVNLFSRPWFGRVWTLQESVLPKNILFLCGSRVLAFADMEPLALPLLRHLTSLQLFFHNAALGESKMFKAFLRLRRIAEFKNLDQESKGCLDTLRLLYFTRPLTASNTLDNVYGILGLADSSFRANVIINYDNTEFQVSRQVAEWYITFGQDLFILNLASSVKRYEGGLPSWIPNITRLGSHWCIGVIWARFRTGMERESVSRPSASFHSDELHVRGIRVDQITQVVPYLGQPSTDQAGKCGNILDWEEKCLELSRSVFGETDISVPDAHCVTIISGICNDHLQPNRSDYDSLKYFLRLISAGKCLPPELEARNQDLADQVLYLNQVLRHGTFFCTQDGRIGLGPVGAQPGDQVCIFYNGVTPFIIRQKPELGSKYELIGDSYTYGLMNGEAFRPEIRKPDETFILI